MKFFLILLGAAFLPSVFAATGPARNETTVILDETAVRNLGIETVAAAESDFETTVSVAGVVDHACGSHSVLSSRIAGRIVWVGIHEGEFARKGEVLARVESLQPGDPPPVVELKAPADGLVMRSDVHLGAPVEPQKELLELLDLSTVWIVAKMPQHEAAILKDGLVAKVRLPALGGVVRAAAYLRPGTNADAAAGTLDAVFELPNPDLALRPGMRAELSLAASSRTGVFAIPRTALQGDRANRFVFIRDYELENAFVRVPVVAGEMNGDRVEIVSGLMPGDEVVTKGSYALSFAGKGGISLKEAMDAAHGHPHKEDGSEMSAEEAARAQTGGSPGSAADSGGGPLTLFLAIACGVLFVLLLVSSFFRPGAKA